MKIRNGFLLWGQLSWKTIPSASKDHFSASKIMSLKKNHHFYWQRTSLCQQNGYLSASKMMSLKNIPSASRDHFSASKMATSLLGKWPPLMRVKWSLWKITPSTSKVHILCQQNGHPFCKKTVIFQDILKSKKRFDWYGNWRIR